MLEYIEITEEDFHDGQESFEGRCLHCGASRFECEPDACHYECEECGHMEVFGLEELLMRGKIVFIDGEADEETDEEADDE
jgi:hypothetical protein